MGNKSEWERYANDQHAAVAALPVRTVVVEESNQNQSFSYVCTKKNVTVTSIQ